MKIQCILVRAGGTFADIDGTQYHFEPLEDGALVADIADRTHIDRFLAISEGYKVYHGDKTPAGSPTPIHLPVINDKQDVRAGGKQTLNGSSVHDESYEINGATVMLGEVVQAAFAASDLTADEWNELEEDDRHAKIDIALDTMAEAGPDASEYQRADIQERDVLVAAYEAKFGKKPHYRMKAETIQAELDA